MKVSPTVRASLELLGVEASVSAGELKKAYHKLALLYHPDRNNDSRSVAEFRKVTEAYDLLSDPVRVTELNKKYLREKLHRPVIEGLQITFGTFFGYRVFNPQVGKNSEAFTRLTGASSKSSSSEKVDEAALDYLGPIEENNSVLDHPAYDAIEVAYAGRMSSADDEALKGQIAGAELARLPWVVINNQGLLRFLDGDLKGAQKRYRELCERVPNNIIFTYRFGLCLILEGFQQPRRTLLGVLKPDRIKINKGIQLLEHCLKLGRQREVGRQRCLVIQKTLADVYEKLGKTRASNKAWKEVLAEDPRCVEAAGKVKGIEEAKRLIRAKLKEAAVAALAGLQKTSSRLLQEGQVSKTSTTKAKKSPEDLV